MYPHGDEEFKDDSPRILQELQMTEVENYLNSSGDVVDVYINNIIIIGIINATNSKTR